MKSNMKHNRQFSHLDESHCQRKCFCFFCFEEVIATIWTNVLLLLPVWGMRLFVLTTTEPGRCHGEKKNVLSIKSFVLVEDKNLNLYVNGCFSPTLLIKTHKTPALLTPGRLLYPPSTTSRCHPVIFLSEAGNIMYWTNEIGKCPTINLEVPASSNIKIKWLKRLMNFATTMPRIHSYLQQPLQNKPKASK